MFDNNPFREFKKMMKETKDFAPGGGGTTQFDDTGRITAGSTGPTAPPDGGMDYNSDREAWDRRGSTPETDENAIKRIKRRKRLRKYATRARGERYRLEHEAEAKRLGITLQQLYKRWDQEDAEDRARLDDYGS